MDENHSLFDEWSDYIIRVLDAEFDYSSLAKHPTELGDAREALIKGVLQRIIPSTYEIGTGIVVDCRQNKSKQIDIVIARRDYPSLLLPHGDRIYLIESVLATIEVKSQLNSDNLHMSLDNCASVNELESTFRKSSQYEEICISRGYVKKENGNFAPPDNIGKAKYQASIRPSTYIFGFNGYTDNSISDFKDSIGKWSTKRREVDKKPLVLEIIPSVIATKGCFACRNLLPFVNEQHPNLCLLGTDPNPLRLIIVHLLFTLSSKVILSSDSNGLMPEIEHYIKKTRQANIVDGLFNWP